MELETKTCLYCLYFDGEKFRDYYGKLLCVINDFGIGGRCLFDTTVGELVKWVAPINTCKDFKRELAGTNKDSQI